MEITDLNLGNYELTVLGYSETNNTSNIPARRFELTFGGMTNPKMENLLKDMNLMNAIRAGQGNPAVKEAFEQLLTVMAISK